MKCSRIIILLALVWPTLSFAQPGPPKNLEDAIRQSRSISQKTFEASKFPGLAIAVSLDGVPVWLQGLGYANMKDSIEIDPYSSLFRIGSISKTLTATALQQLVQLGKIDLDQPVQTYVKYFPEKEYPLTVRQTAGHIGGVRHYKGFEMMSNIFYPTIEESLNIFMRDPLLFEPGTKYSYSSYGWNLISAVIEEASQTPFLEYMQKQIFDLAGMNNTSPEIRTSLPSGLVSFYQHGMNHQILLAPDVDNSYKWAGGGFIATAEDLLKFSDAVYTFKIVSKELLREFQSANRLSDGSKTNYGLGWSTNTDKKGRPWVGHSGGSIGGTSMFLTYPEYGLTVVTLVNLSSAKMDQLAWRIAEQFLTVLETVEEDK
ncbi:MAG: serine hydrolase domain-containing protein [Cyclobacteriaceae bacterium]